ncbi:MAG TPA: hypothetical protein PLS21_04140 [Synergistales bacterium]|nr:hypothetical protein [Synergistales bacterium]HQO83167.1 hypothetical protein [Synergistales bacterium]
MVCCVDDLPFASETHIEIYAFTPETERAIHPEENTVSLDKPVVRC